MHLARLSAAQLTQLNTQHSAMSGSEKACCAAEDLDEMNIEIMRNTLYKAYLDDFAKFCNKLGGSTAAVMGDLLSFEVGVCIQPCACFTPSALTIRYPSYLMHWSTCSLRCWTAGQRG